MRRKERQLVRSAIKRGAVFRAVETEFDRVHAADAEREGRAADHDAGEDAGDEAPVDDQERDGDKRQIVDKLQLSR